MTDGFGTDRTFFVDSSKANRIDLLATWQRGNPLPKACSRHEPNDFPKRSRITDKVAHTPSEHIKEITMP
jgi:hypothetical protein